jgi:serine/threonine-protein kinase
LPDLSQRLQDALSDRYRIERTLGRGGVATVFLAEDLKHHRSVAIKVLDPEVATTIGPERFLREIETVANLTHPHILPLHDSGVANCLLFYVMPFVEGESLRDRLTRERQLPVEDALRIAGEVADALDYAHRHGVVHRDVKPENILLEEGHAVVADFGIARAVAAAHSERLTATGIVVGTPAYMSPEQAVGSRDLDGRSDLYSLGCVLYEMLAGQPPFTGPTAESLAHQHLNVAPRPVTEIRPAVPAAVAAVLQLALAKAPADRYPNAHGLSSALSGTFATRAVSVPAGARNRRVSIAWPLGALALALAAGAAIRWWPHEVDEGQIRSLAVLPLDNLSGDPAQDYFADGMTEELTDALARIGSLRIISRTSAMSLKNAKLKISEIARRLNVDAVIEGTVARQGSRVRITAELIRARPERHVWGDRYDREVQDVLGLQADVAQAIAQQIRVQLKPEERAQLGYRRRVDPEAYEAYLRGRSFLNRLDKKLLQSALASFQRSVRLDSSYAPAWAGIADTYYQLSNIYLSPRKAMPLARTAALRAIRLDPTLAEGHASLGGVYAAYDWEWGAAEEEYRRSLQLDPNHAQTHLYYSQLLQILGRLDESIAQMRVALQLNPLSTYTRVNATYLLYVAGHEAEAIAQLMQLEQTEPAYAPIHFNLGQVYDAMNRHGEAVVEFRRAISLSDTPFPRALLSASLARAGERREARALLAELEHGEGEEHLSSVAFAMVYAALGDRDAAFRRLEMAYADRDEDLPYLKTEPNLSGLRSDPRFHDLLRRMRLENQTSRRHSRPTPRGRGTAINREDGSSARWRDSCATWSADARLPMQPASAPGASAQGPAQLELARRAFDGIFPPHGPVAQTDRAAVS